MTGPGNRAAQERDLARGAAVNSLLALLGFLFPVVVGVALTPYVVHRLGTEAYGIIALTIVLVGLLGVLDLGMGSSVLKYVSEHVAREEYDAVSRVVGAGVLFYSLVGVTGGLAAACVGLFWVDDLFDVPSNLADDARFAFVAAGGAFLFTMLLNAVGAIPAALQRFGLTTTVTVSLSTVNAAATVLLLSNGYGLRALVVLNMLLPLTATVVFVVFVRRMLPGVRFVPRWDAEQIRRMAQFGGYALVVTLSSVVLFQLDKFLLGAFAGVAAVTFYVVPAALSQKIHSAASQLATITFPVSSSLSATGDMERVRSLYFRATGFVVLFVVTVAIPPSILARPLLQHWLGGAFPARSTTALILLNATYALVALTAVPFYVLLGLGRPRVAALFSVVSAALNIALVVVLVPSYGVVGAAVAFLLSTAPVPFFILFVEKRVLVLARSPWPSLLARLTIPALAQAGLCLVLAPFVSNLFEVLAVILIALPIPVGLYYALGFFDAADRELLARLVPWPGSRGA